MHRRESQRLNEELYRQEKQSCDWHVERRILETRLAQMEGSIQQRDEIDGAIESKMAALFSRLQQLETTNLQLEQSNEELKSKVTPVGNAGGVLWGAGAAGHSFGAANDVHLEQNDEDLSSKVMPAGGAGGLRWDTGAAGVAAGVGGAGGGGRGEAETILEEACGGEASEVGPVWCEKEPTAAGGVFGGDAAPAGVTAHPPAEL